MAQYVQLSFFLSVMCFTKTFSEDIMPHKFYKYNNLCIPYLFSYKTERLWNAFFPVWLLWCFVLLWESSCHCCTHSYEKAVGIFCSLRSSNRFTFIVIWSPVLWSNISIRDGINTVILLSSHRDRTHLHYLTAWFSACFWKWALW